MCWCNKSIRTPCCGMVGCHPPVDGNLISEETIMQNSQLQLWQSYTDKKQECERLYEIIDKIPQLIKCNAREKEVHDCWGMTSLEVTVDGDNLEKDLLELIKEV